MRLAARAAGWEADRASRTQAEARAEALDALVPAAVKSLAAHLGDGDPAAWRAALRVFELQYGKPAEQAEIDVDPLRVREMTSAERAAMIARLLDNNPELAELVPERLRAVQRSAGPASV